MNTLWPGSSPGRVQIKICGITRQSDLDEAGRLGVTALGLNFFPKSPRFISQETANRLLAKWPTGVIPVGLLVHPTKESVQNLLDNVPGLAWLQFHRMEAPPEWAVPRPWFPAFSPASAEEVDKIYAWLEKAKSGPTPPSAVLVDGHAPGMEGGTGNKAPWNLLKDFQPGIPWILAGGLKPSNVAEALEILRPNAIDLASGVEDSPGIKSPRLMAELVHQAWTGSPRRGD